MSRDGDERSPTVPGVVDFNALHAALGELPPAPQPSASAAESQGRTNATYASTRPHAIPHTRPPVAAVDTPAVIIQTDDTVPTGPPIQMTVPMAGAPPFGSAGSIRPPVDVAAPAPVPTYEAPAADVQVALPTRPRRPRTPTIVMRPRGPTRLQKVIVFVAMLVVFVAGGVAFLVYGKAFGLDIDVPVLISTPPPRRPTPAVTPPAVPSLPPSPAAASAPPSAAASAPASASVSASASAKKPPRRTAPTP
jgi:hypothetical protein